MRPGRPLRLQLLASLAAALAPPLVAAAPQAGALTHRRPVGLAWSFEERSQLALDLRLTGGGQNIAVRQAVDDALRGDATVTAADGHRATRVRVTIDAGSKSRSTVQGQAAETPSPLAGLTLEATLEGQRVSALSGAGGTELDPASRRTLEQLVVVDAALLPERALEVGASWRANPPRAADELRPDLELRVERFVARGGRGAVELACQGTLSGAPGGLRLDADVEGRLLVDLESGLVLESRLAGPARSSGEVDSGGTKLHIEGSGRVEFTASATLLPASTGAAPEAGLEGAWTGPDGTAADVHADLVLLRRGPEAFAGRITSRTEGAARGEFAYGGTLHPFELHGPRGDALTLRTGGRALELRRSARAAVARNPFGDDTVAAPPAPADARAGWVEYAHPAGASLRHPPKWRTEASAVGVLLVPEGSDRNQEVVLAFGDAAGGETDPLGPRALATIDALVAGTLPGFTRRGAPTEVALASGKAGAYEYRGRGPDGRALRCRVLVRFSGGAALGLSHLASEALVERRRADLEAVLDTFGHAAPKPAQPGGKAATDDPRLIGVFAGEALAGGGDRGAYVNTQLVYVLNPDGTALSGARSAMNASQRDGSGNLVWTAGGETGQSVLRGTWSARQGLLTVDWQGQGRTIVAYGFEPDGTLALRDAQTRKLINIYTRVQ